MVYHATVIYFCSTEKNRIFLKNGCRNKTETPHDDSSNIDEVIRSVLNMFFFFFKIIFHKYKKEYKALKSTKNTTNLRFINLKFIDIRFINLKFIDIRFISLKFIDIRFISLKFIDIRFINLRFIDIRFIKLKKHLSGKK